MERKWWTLIAVSVATFMLLLDITVVNTALPSIEEDLNATFTDLQWVVDAYTLSLAALVLTAGVLADRLGIQLPSDRDFSTVAGFALELLKHLPETGEKFAHDGWSFEIVDMDGRKIDKLIAARTKRKKQRTGTEAV